MNGADTQRKKAVVLLVITAFLWSLGGLLIKWVDWNPMAIAGMRSAIAGLLILAVLRRPRFTWSFAEIGAAVCYAATTILFVLSNKLTTAANAILLQYTAPIYVALFSSWFLKERITLFDWAIIAIVMGGMALFFLDSLTPGNYVGNVCAILAGVGFAGTALFVRKQKEKVPLESILLGNAINAVICLPFMFQSMPDPQGWAGLFLLGIFQLGLSYILYAIASRHVTALNLILIPILEPLLNPIWVFFLMGEEPGPFALVGGAVVLISVTVRGIVVARKNASP
jgi:drug/metabolite transporter (DMT)-like permease